MIQGYCPICSNESKWVKICEAEKGKRQIVSCECGLQSIHPLPTKDELQEIYGEGYYNFWGIENNFQQMFNLKLKTCKSLITQANALMLPSDKKHHLDIGCAFGYMIEAARFAGYESQGLEISPAAEEAIRLGYNVHKVMLGDAAFPSEYFDLVTAVDVLEHIPEPRKWLEECKRILKKRGILLLVTPNCVSLPAVIRKGMWPHYKAEHLYYYSPHTLKRLLSSIGFEKVNCKIGTRYLSLNYITGHYAKFQPESIETNFLKGIKVIFPQKILEYPLPFPSEMVVFSQKI